jgi:tryptophan synthase alpha subunit
LKSLKSLKDRVRKAADQIATAGVPGTIALDLSMAWNRDNRPIISKVQSQMYPLIAHTRARQFFDEHKENLYRWCSDAGVLGVVVFDFSLRLRPNDQWGMDGMTMWFPTTREDEPENPDYRIFHSNFSRGIPGVTNLDDEE